MAKIEIVVDDVQVMIKRAEASAEARDAILELAQKEKDGPYKPGERYCSEIAKTLKTLADLYDKRAEGETATADAMAMNAVYKELGITK